MVASLLGEGKSSKLGASKFQASGIYNKYSGNPIANLAKPITGMKAFSDPSILYDKGKYQVWFPCSNGKFSQICYASSSDGFKWNSHPEPVLKVGHLGSWEDYSLDTPAVIKDGSTYKMWYSGYSRAEPDIYKNIGYATSPDGINWERKGIAITLDQIRQGEIYSIADPEVVKVKGIYHMWYNGFGTEPFGMIAISHATSKDGINWERDPLNPVLIPSKPWEMQNEKEGSVNQPAVLWDGENFQMWYGSFADELMRYSAVSHAVSKDGSNWVKDDAPAIVPDTEDFWPSATAVKIGSEIRIYYIGFPKLGDPQQLYLAIYRNEEN